MKAVIVSVVLGLLVMVGFSYAAEGTGEWLSLSEFSVLPGNHGAPDKMIRYRYEQYQRGVFPVSTLGVSRLRTEPGATSDSGMLSFIAFSNLPENQAVPEKLLKQKYEVYRGWSGPIASNEDAGVTSDSGILSFIEFSNLPENRAVPEKQIRQGYEVYRSSR